MDYQEIIIIILSLLLSAFFSGTEIAFVSANKLYFELQKKEGNWAGAIITRFIKKPSQFISTLLVGNTITLVVYGIYMAELLNPWILTLLPFDFRSEIIVLILQTLASTVLVLITAEFLPKTIFMFNPDRFLEVLAVPAWLVYQAFYWPVWLIVSLSHLLIRYGFNLKYSEGEAVYKLVDINNYLERSLNDENQEEDLPIDSKIFNNAVLFKNVKVRDCLIPRTELVAVEIEDPIDKLKKAFIQSGFSKIIVFQDSIDNVIGYCHSGALFQTPKDIRSILSDIIIIPETTPAQELLVQFIQKHKSIALVVDEFGGTSGIVTLEDIVEEILGEIQDEYDKEAWIERQEDERTFLLSARHEIDYLNEKYGWEIPDGEYDTLGGFILYINENIPQPKEIIKYPPFTFYIQAIEYSRIDTIRVILDKPFQNPSLASGASSENAPLKLQRSG